LTQSDNDNERAENNAASISNVLWKTGEESSMSEENKIAIKAARWGWSLDVWAVAAALLLALLVRVGVLKHIPW
jgi:hypothetical protein